MMKPISTPSLLHEVFGERPIPLEIFITLGFGLAVAATTVAGLPLVAVPTWRVAIAATLALDIGAGCVANFTRSTNRWYATRPFHRWVFLAIHAHVLGVAWALGQNLLVAVAVWAYTIASASVVNLLAGRSAQRFVAGVLLAVGCIWIPTQSITPPLLVAVYLLFLVKVEFAFAVDHYCEARVHVPGQRATGHIQQN